MLDRKELILEGLAYTVMGILVVFAILIIIMLVIKAMALFSTDGKEKSKKETAPAPTPVVKEEIAPAKSEDDKVIVAVITAAIAAILGESAQGGFRIRSYKKISDGAWNKAGRREVLDNRI